MHQHRIKQPLQFATLSSLTRYYTKYLILSAHDPNPAFLISRFNPIQALRGRSGQVSGALLRKSLVVAQFGLATILLVGTFVIGSQMRFISDRDPGFDRKHTFTFDGRNFTPQFKQALSGESSILGVSTSTETPVNVLTGTLSTDWDGKAKDMTAETQNQAGNRSRSP